MELAKKFALGAIKFCALLIGLGWAGFGQVNSLVETKIERSQRDMMRIHHADMRHLGRAIDKIEKQNTLILKTLLRTR